jgi:hypothetical protein
MMAADRADKSGATDPEVEAELNQLPKMRIVDLRSRYRELFRTEPPPAFGPDLLRRSIAHRIQERAFGGLSREHQRLLDQLVKAARTKPNGRIELPRRIKPGLRVGADLESEDLPGRGLGKGIRLGGTDLLQSLRDRLSDYRDKVERATVFRAAIVGKPAAQGVQGQ